MSVLRNIRLRIRKVRMEKKISQSNKLENLSKQILEKHLMFMDFFLKTFQIIIYWDVTLFVKYVNHWIPWFCTIAWSYHILIICKNTKKLWDVWTYHISLYQKHRKHSLVHRLSTCNQIVPRLDLGIFL